MAEDKQLYWQVLVWKINVNGLWLVRMVKFPPNMSLLEMLLPFCAESILQKKTNKKKKSTDYPLPKNAPPKIPKPTLLKFSLSDTSWKVYHTETYLYDFSWIRIFVNPGTYSSSAQKITPLCMNQFWCIFKTKHSFFFSLFFTQQSWHCWPLPPSNEYTYVSNRPDILL